MVAMTASMSLLAALLLASRPASAHAPVSGADKPPPYALIYGTVWDPEGRPLYGVKVKIRLAGESKTRWEVFSNHTGEFAQRVPTKADYIVWADVKGYKLASGKHLKPGAEVTAHIEADERCDVGIHLNWQ